MRRLVELLASILLIFSPHVGASNSFLCPETVEGAHGDVASIDGILDALYEVRNLPPGASRQWEREKNLFAPDVILVGLDGAGLTTYDYATFNAETEAMVSTGFFETETKRSVKRFGNIANVFSAYETRFEEGGKVEARGINSFQLYCDGRRWWIANLIWQSERQAGISMPADMSR